LVRGHGGRSLTVWGRGCADDELSEDEGDEELQKLKHEYLKSVQRAHKAFNQRMESLEKYRQDKEDSHHREVEKFEKMMADFDRRLHVAEDEQMQRLKLLQGEWKVVCDQRKDAARSRRPLPA
jgi:hypothetical protein